VQPVYDSRVSSGLSTPEFFDWPEHAAAEMERLAPEIAVFIIGANDWRAPGTGRADDGDAQAWEQAYALRVEAMLDVLEGSAARRVYWVGSPPMEDAKKDAGVRAVNEAARPVIERHPDAAYVDAYDLFLGEDGEYTETRPGPDGRAVRVRAGDGIHFTPEGGDVLGAEVYDLLDALCALDDQAVPGAAKPVLRTKGSTEVAGTNRGSGTTATAPVPVPPPSISPAPAPTSGSGSSSSSTPTSATTATTATSSPAPEDPPPPEGPPPGPPADTPPT
jgi:hypothetical protein